MRYLDELARELARVGFRGARRARILAEVEDHLREAGDADAFGSPQLVAQRFADELATSGARRGAMVAFLALAPIGVAYAFLLAPFNAPPDITSGQIVPLGVAAALLMVLAPQIALASGVLAVVRAWHLRRGPVAPAAEVRILRRRAGVALAAGAATLASLAVYAIDYRAGLPAWWIAFVPFPTAVLAQFIETDGARAAAVLYGATLTLTAITFFVWWRYASAGRRLIAPGVADETVDDVTRAYTPGTLLYGGAMVIGFVAPWLSAALYLAIAVFYALPLAQWRARLLPKA